MRTMMKIVMVVDDEMKIWWNAFHKFLKKGERKIS